MSTSTNSKNLYTKLQKQYSRRINLDLKRINLALNKLGNIHELIKNPINIIGSDGKYSTLKSLQYFIQENKEKVSTFTVLIYMMLGIDFGSKINLSVLKS